MKISFKWPNLRHFSKVNLKIYIYWPFGPSRSFNNNIKKESNLAQGVSVFWEKKSKIIFQNFWHRNPILTKMSASEQMRAMLDQLMGTARNGKLPFLEINWYRKFSLSFTPIFTMNNSLKPKLSKLFFLRTNSKYIIFWFDGSSDVDKDFWIPVLSRIVQIFELFCWIQGTIRSCLEARKIYHVMYFSQYISLMCLLF